MKPSRESSNSDFSFRRHGHDAANGASGHGASPSERAEKPVRVLIGFGGNEGDSEAFCRSAMAALSELEGLRVLAVSSLYRTEPIGYREQPWFVNGVILGETVLSPEDLLAGLLEVEKSFGRVRTVRWGPRPLDLDIIFFGDRVIESHQLVIPHPRAHERRFVLEPAAEVCPEFVHPVLGLSVQELLSRPEVQSQDVRLWKPL